MPYEIPLETQANRLGICINVDACVQIGLSGLGYNDGKLYQFYKLTQATTITSDVSSQYQLNLTFYGVYLPLVPPGHDDFNVSERCKEGTEVPISDAFHVLEKFGDYSLDLLELAPGADGDCVAAKHLPWYFRFAHKDCGPFLWDLSPSPTEQPTKTYPSSTSYAEGAVENNSSFSILTIGAMFGALAVVVTLGRYRRGFYSGYVPIESSAVGIEVSSVPTPSLEVDPNRQGYP